MTLTFSLQELEKRVQYRFDNECEAEAQLTKHYLANKLGCDLTDVTLPDNFTDNLFIIENGANHLSPPYWVKRIVEGIVVLRTGRLFSEDSYSERLWEDAVEDEDGGFYWEGDNYHYYSFPNEEDRTNLVSMEDDDYADYSKNNGWAKRRKAVAENISNSSYLPECKLVPYNKELVKTLLWREDYACLAERNKELHRYSVRRDFIKKTAKYALTGFNWVLAAVGIWIAAKYMFKVI